MLTLKFEFQLDICRYKKIKIDQEEPVIDIMESQNFDVMFKIIIFLSIIRLYSIHIRIMHKYIL